MSNSRELDSARIEENALPPAVAREIRGLKAVNKILVEKVIELEDVVAKLRRGEREEFENEKSHVDEPEEAMPKLKGLDHRLRPRQSLMVDVEPAGLESGNAPLFLESAAPKTSASTATAPEITTTPLPKYSRLLPPIDRTKAGEDFYADLQDKRIIPGYNEDRFSCWCHVAKEQSGKVYPSENLSNSHSDVASMSGSSVRRYKTFRWFAHARRCAFYSNPWATTGPDGTGERRYPQFPLPKPGTDHSLAEEDVDEASESSEPPRGSKRKICPTVELVPATDEDSDQGSGTSQLNVKKMRYW